MSYPGYSSDEYDFEVRYIVHQNYICGHDDCDEHPELGRACLADRLRSYQIYRELNNAYRDGISPDRAAKRIAYVARLRRRARFWFGEGPRIESGYADRVRIGSRRDWQTVMVSESLNERARYLGRRQIEGSWRHVWRVGRYLYAQLAFT